MTAMHFLRQPMTVSQIIAGAWMLYQRQFNDFVMMGTIGALPGFISSLVVTPAATRLWELARGQRDLLSAQDWLVIVGLGLPLTALSFYTLTAMYHAAGEVGERGSFSPARSFRVAQQRLPTLAVVGILSLLVPAALAATLVGIPVALYLAVSWLVSPFAALAEGRGPLQSLGRSYQLVKGNWWRCFGVLLALAGLVFFLPTFVVYGLFGFLFANELSQALIGLVINALTVPFLAAGEAALYFDLRARKGEFIGSAEYGTAQSLSSG